MRIKWILLFLACISPLKLPAQRFTKQTIYVGAMGGFATLSGDAGAAITSTSASTSLFDPSNGGVGEAFAGTHLFEYVSFEGDYIWNRNQVNLIATTTNAGTTSFYRQPETFTQNTVLGNVLIYFRKRDQIVRPFLSEGAGGILIHNAFAGLATASPNAVLPPAGVNHASIALRTQVGMDVRLRRRWSFRYAFGETIDRNTFGDQLLPQEHRIPKSFQNLFGAYFRF